MDLENLIDSIVTQAENGSQAFWMSTQEIRVSPIQMEKKRRPPDWTPEEHAFVREHLGIMGIAEMARALGRSEQAIKIHVTRSGCVTPRHAPGWISGNGVAKILGVDSHKPPCWMDLGILQGERFPYPGRICRRVKTIIFKMWIIQPTSWVYFDAWKIINPHLRRLVKLAQERWGDEWWSTRQAADYLKCDTKDVLRQIKLGRLNGYHAIGMDRRRTFGWAYWFVRKSEILQLKIPRKGGLRVSTRRADEFILKARSQGLEHQVIARMMKWPQKRVEYRWHVLKNGGRNGTTK